MSDPSEVTRAQLVLAREHAMAAVTEQVLEGQPGEASEALLAWQLADQTLVMTFAMQGLLDAAIVGWAEASGRPVREVLQDLALRVAVQH